MEQISVQQTRCATGRVRGKVRVALTVNSDRGSSTACTVVFPRALLLAPVCAAAGLLVLSSGLKRYGSGFHRIFAFPRFRCRVHLGLGQFLGLDIGVQHYKQGFDQIHKQGSKGRAADSIHAL